MDLGQELIGVLIVERERHADEDRGEEEHQEIALPQQLQRIKAEQLPEAPLARRPAASGGVCGSVKL